MKLIIVLLVVFLVFLVTFLIARSRGKHDFLDIIWGMGFVVSSALSALLGNRSPVGLLMTLMVLIWGLRLSVHLFQRISKSQEDYRYQEYRKKYTGRHFDAYFFFRMYVVQYVLNIIIGFDVIYVNLYGDVRFSYITVIGLLVWMAGFVFETVADHQLKIFKGNPENRGRLMTEGLWKYSRHPNYFGEVSQWWGIYVMAISGLSHFWLLFSPLTITLFILFVSGVPLLEKKYKGRADWEAYRRKTSMFIPLPPRRG